MKKERTQFKFMEEFISSHKELKRPSCSDLEFRINRIKIQIYVVGRSLSDYLLSYKI